MEQLAGALDAALALYPEAAAGGARAENCLHVALLGQGAQAANEEAFVALASEFLAPRTSALQVNAHSHRAFPLSK